MTKDLFDIKGRTCIITGGGGLLGIKHAEATIIGGGIPVLLGRNESRLIEAKAKLEQEYPDAVIEIHIADVTKNEDLFSVRDAVIGKYGHIDILINNAANNPKVEENSENMNATKFTDLSLDVWNKDIEVGLTGALLCCQIFGKCMEDSRTGVILNISSDYGIMAPDQRLYRKKGLPDDKQTIKPVTYSVVKHGIIGLSKYLAAYWGTIGIRVNTLCPSGIYNGQDEEFLEKYIHKIPMGRMSVPDDYIGTILYMISDASSFMTGATIVVDGGKSIW